MNQPTPPSWNPLEQFMGQPGASAPPVTHAQEPAPKAAKPAPKAKPRATPTTAPVGSAPPEAPGQTATNAAGTPLYNAAVGTGQNGVISTGSSALNMWNIPTDQGALQVNVKNPTPGTNEMFGGLTAQATVDDLLKQGLSLSADDLKGLQSKLWLAGMYGGTSVKSAAEIPFGHYDENTIGAYANLLTLTAQQNARGMDNTYIDTMNELVQQRMLTGQANPSGSKTSTSTSYDLSDPETAKGILTNVLQSLTGRSIPNPNEVAGFQQALGSYEQENPSTSTSTTNSDGTQTDTSRAGTSALKIGGKNQVAQDYLYANDGNEIANHAAATTYYQAALATLKNPIQLG